MARKPIARTDTKQTKIGGIKLSTSYRGHRFSYRKNMGKALSAVKKIGVRSIFDIISDSDMSLKNKINYIRHHYVYYEGNYDLFHDENGKATSAKYNLDRVIHKVITGELDPIVLNNFNKEIVKLRKEKDTEKAKIEEENEKNHTLLGLPKYKLDIISHGGSIENNSCKPYLDLIDKYVNTLDTQEKQRCFFTKSYKEMKKLAEDWNKKQNEPEQIRGIKKPQKESYSNFIKAYKKFAKTQGWN